MLKECTVLDSCGTVQYEVLRALRMFAGLEEEKTLSALQPACSRNDCSRSQTQDLCRTMDDIRNNQKIVTIVLAFSLLLASLPCVVAASLQSDVPQTFTLAFHITATAPELPLLSRFLNATYHEENIYLLDIPLSPEYSLPTALDSAVNIHVRRDNPPTPRGVSVALRTLSAMAFFLDWSDSTNESFDYFLNTSPSEYPAVTPDHMRALLYSPLKNALPVPNFIELTPASSLHLFKGNYNMLAYDPVVVFSQNASATELIHTGKAHPDRIFRKRPYLPHSPTSSFIVSQAAARVFSDSLLAKRALLVLAEATDAALHFFPTVAADMGASAGPWVTHTALRCVDPSAAAAALRMDAKSAVDGAQGAGSAVGSIQPARTPCLFVKLSTFNGSDVRDVFDSLFDDGRVMVAPLASISKSILVDIEGAIKLSEGAHLSSTSELPL